MVVLRRRTYRAASVPVVRHVHEEPVVSLPDPIYHSHRSRAISNAAIENSDALSAASKRNDQYLIKEINDRLAHAALSHPAPMIRRHSVSRAPSVSRTVPTSSIRLLTLSNPSAVDHDVNKDVDLLMPMTSRVLRGGSVPPVLNRTALVPVYHHTPVPIIKTSVVQNGSALVPLNGHSYGYYVPPVPESYSRYYVEKVPIPDSYYYQPLSAARLTPTADIAVRQAHRDLDRIEQELKSDATLAPPATPIPTIRTYATMEAGPSLRRRTAYYGGPVTGVSVKSVGPDYYPTYYGSTLPYYSSSSSTLPYYYNSTSTLPYYYNSTSALPYYSYGAEPLSYTTYTTPRFNTLAPDSDVLTIKSIGNSAPDYYSSSSTLPYGLGYSGAISPSSVQLSSNIDALLLASKTGIPSASSYVRPASASVTSFSPPTSFSPAPSSFSSSASAPPPVVKPQMSQARRRAREVLCRVKNDPKYYD